MEPETEARSSEPETRNPKPGNYNLEPENQNAECYTTGNSVWLSLLLSLCRAKKGEEGTIEGFQCVHFNAKTRVWP
jgi:hypothetical protein